MRNEPSIRKGTIMTKTMTPTLLALACLMATPSVARARYSDGMNLYEYVKSNAVTNKDAFGKMSLACCNDMLTESFGKYEIARMVVTASGSRDGLGIPCLRRVKCKESCMNDVSGGYNPISRNVSMCARGLGYVGQGEFDQILIHELIHAMSVCGWWSPGCRNCMIEEKRAYFLSGMCTDDETCTQLAWGSCKASFSCFDLLNKWENYLGVGWPVNPLE
jgi:hypothetical protein